MCGITGKWLRQLFALTLMGSFFANFCGVAHASLVSGGAEPQVDQMSAGSLDLDGLKQGLRETDAIGLIAKLSLRSALSDLVSDFERYHDGTSEQSLGALEGAFDRLYLRALFALEAGDPPLFESLARSRTALWDTVTDPDLFRAAVEQRHPIARGRGVSSR